VDDATLLRIMTPRAGEVADAANTRKERELGSLFARLSVVECRGMHLRMSRVRAGDPLSEAFGTLTQGTRERLLAYLLDDRRLQQLARRAG